MSGGLYNPHLTQKTHLIMEAVAAVAGVLRSGKDPTAEQLRYAAELIEESQGTTDLDVRNPQVLQMLTAWNQILLGCLLKELDPKPYTGLIDAVFGEPENEADEEVEKGG